MSSNEIVKSKDECGQMNMDGLCELIIIGENLDRDTIEINLNLKETPSKFGFDFSKPRGNPLRSSWRYQTEFREGGMNLDESAQELLSKIEVNAEFLRQISKKNEVYVKILVQSDDNPIPFELSADTIRRFSALGLSISFVVYCWDEASEE